MVTSGVINTFGDGIAQALEGKLYDIKRNLIFAFLVGIAFGDDLHGWEPRSEHQRLFLDLKGQSTRLCIADLWLISRYPTVAFY